MARPSKLTKQQWEDFERRLLHGETQASLCREYGVSKQIASARFSDRSRNIKHVANQIVTANSQLLNLDQSGQRAALDLASALMQISSNVASAALSGSYTAMRLSQIAANQIDKIDEESPIDPDSQSERAIKAIAILSKTGNEASLISRELLNTQAKKKEEPQTQDIAQTLAELTAKLPG